MRFEIKVKFAGGAVIAQVVSADDLAVQGPLLMQSTSWVPGDSITVTCLHD